MADFYAHFADKEELAATSCAFALDQTKQALLAVLQEGGFPALIDFYLGEEHRDQPETGCLLPALAAEVARQAPSSREAFTTKLSEFFDAFVERMPGQTLEQKRAKVYAMFAALVGAVSLARAVSDASLSKAMLEATREQLLPLFIEDTD